MLNHLAKLWKLNGINVATSFDTTCITTTNRLFGGYQKIACGDRVERTYSSLHEHKMISFETRFYIVDDWQPDAILELKIDGVSVISFEPYKIIAKEGSQLCGTSSHDVYVRIVGNLLHSGSDLTTEFTSYPPHATAYYGFKDTKILLRQELKYLMGFWLMTSGSDKTYLPRIYPCNAAFYSDSNGNCLPCHATCEICFGPSASECSACANSHSFSNEFDACIKCTSDCLTCSGSNQNQCHGCNNNKYTYWDHTCRSSCATSLYDLSDFSYFKYCKTHCQDSNTFLLPDNTCSDSCDLPLQFRIDGEAKFCESPCSNLNDYLYWDGSCKASCNYPKNQNGFKLCDACPTNYYMYLNNTCLPDCPPPYTKGIQGGSRFCDPFCPAGQFYYQSEPHCRKTCSYPYQIENDIFCNLGLPKEETEQIKTTTETLSTTSSISSTVGSSISVINFSNPAAIFIEAFADMLKYLRYVNIRYPPKLEYSFQLKVDPPFSFTPPLPDDIIDQIPKYKMPERFEIDEDLHSSFLINFWDSITAILEIIIIVGFTTLISQISKSSKKLQWICTKVLKMLKWNFFIALLTSHFGDIAFYSAVELRTVNPNSSLQALSFSICFIINFLVYIVLGKMISIVMTRWSLLKSPSDSQQESTDKTEDLDNKFSQYEVVFEDCKDKLLIQQAFVCIFVARLYVFIGVIGYLFHYPLVQMIILTLLTFGMLLYLIILRPQKSMMDLTQYVLQELIILIVVVSVLVLSIFDAMEIEETETRDILGDVIINCNIAFSGVSGIYLIIQTLFQLRETYKYLSICLKKRKTAPPKLSFTLRPSRNESTIKKLEEVETSQIREDSLFPDQKSSINLSTSYSADVYSKQMRLLVANSRILNTSSRSSIKNNIFYENKFEKRKTENFPG